MLTTSELGYITDVDGLLGCIRADLEGFDKVLPTSYREQLMATIAMLEAVQEWCDERTQS